MLRPCFICFALWMTSFAWVQPGHCAAEPKHPHPQKITVKKSAAHRAAPRKVRPRARRARLSAQTSFSLFSPALDNNAASLRKFAALEHPAQSGLMLPVTPEFKPATDILTPKNTVTGEPGYADYVAPGISATVRTGRNTRVTGAVNLPGFSSPPPRPYEEPESGNKPAAAAGVKVTRSF